MKLERLIALPGWKRLAAAAFRMSQTWRHWKRRWWKFRFFLEAEGSIKDFSCEQGLRIDVPVRVGEGKGALHIRENVGLGWANAPRLGDGTILLEPRSAEAMIEIGAGSRLSNNISIVAMAGIRIGERCLIGDSVSIYDCDFHELDPLRRMEGGPVEPVSVGNNVWIGSRAIILRGVTIGDNSVIGAGSLVTRNVPPDCVAAGIPAKVIREI